MGNQLVFLYTNWRGATERRRVLPISIYFGPTIHEVEPRWRLKAYCHDREAERNFIIAEMKDIREEEV